MPGKLELGGDAELELHPGRRPHRRRHGGLGAVRRACWSRATTSRPSRSRCSPRAARATPTWRPCCDWRPYVEQAEWVVPGHGAAIDGARALAILREDVKYLESLGGAGEPALPLARRDRVQKKIHAENVARVGASS